MAKILILEDDHFLAKAYIAILEREGYDVSHATNGLKGIELTKSQSFDIILLDILMPELGGMDFLRVFHPTQHPETKVIVFSNMSTQESIHEAIKLGAHKYLTKATVSPREMAELIKNTLAGGKEKTETETEPE